MSQLCSICKVVLVRENSYLLTKGRGAGRFHAYCNSCASLRRRRKYAEDPKRAIAISRDWQLRNPEKVKKMSKRCNLMQAYSLSLELYQAMLAHQKGKCKIYQEVLGEPHVDHNHGTGKIRGLLCSACNVGLGCYKDSVIRLTAAAEYLKKYG